MEGAPVTAATGTLGPVVAKLGALLGSEYKLRRRTRKDIKFIRSKLKPVHSILWAAWGEEILDAESKDLKKEALDLADDMLDAIDDFILTLEASRRSKHLIKVQTKMKASPFQDFRARVNEVSVRCRSKWKSAQPISSLFSRKKNNHPRIPPPRAPFVRKDAADIFGMDRWKNDLITYLIGEGGEEEGTTAVQPQLKTASIVGMAGVGKTTLASLVYEEIGNKFQSRAFVSVTPTPNMKEVLTSILKQVGAQPPVDTQAMTEEGLIHPISNFLDDKRYLVIIDDIWHREEWDIITKSFPQNNLASRIVITTRVASVPGDDLDNSKLCIRMNPVWSSRKERWLYGFYEEDIVAWMKPDMVGEGFDCDHPIVRMCGSVSLALLCMFSAMAMVLREQQEQLGVHVKACDVQDMIEKQVKQNGIQNTPGFEPLVQSLQLDYTNLPHHMLKTCLLYCSVYPENYPFRKNDLVMRWVAEGFTYKVDEAEEYFEELSERGLLMQHNHDSAYQLNPMMRNFLRRKSHEDNFITYSSDITWAYPYRIHRLCIDKHPGDDGAPEGVDPFSLLDWPQIRSLVVFKDAERLPIEKLERVRVLDLQFEKGLGNHHVMDICGLLRVKHLFGVNGLGISELPLEIARLHYLETLDVSGMRIRELPREIGRLKKLKNLYVSFNRRITELPREMGDLHHLEILCMRGTDITELPREIIGGLKKLKTLDLSYNKGLRELPREIGDLQHLETLDLSGIERMTNLPREIGKLQHLKTLKARWTRITKLPSEIGNLHNLETLDLMRSHSLTELPREIGNLQNLERLLLSSTAVVKLPREIGGLKKLEILDLHNIVGRARALPWEASQLPKLEGVPKWVRQAWKNSDLVSCVLAREILSIEMLRWEGDTGGLIVGTKHMHVPQWIKDHFNGLRSLDIRIGKVEEEQDLKILREMPNLCILTLRLEVVPREPIAVSGEGFPRLWKLIVDCRMPRVITFQEGAMPMLEVLEFEFQFYGGPPPPANEDYPPVLGIKRLGSLGSVEFRCNKEWYGGAAESRSPCMSAMIDVVRKEAREHPNKIYFHVTGRAIEVFLAKESLAREVSSSSSRTGAESFPKKNSAQEVSSSSGTGEIKEEEEEEEIMEAAASSVIGFLP